MVEDSTRSKGHEPLLSRPSATWVGKARKWWRKGSRRALLDPVLKVAYRHLSSRLRLLQPQQLSRGTVLPTLKPNTTHHRPPSLLLNELNFRGPGDIIAIDPCPCVHGVVCRCLLLPSMVPPPPVHDTPAFQPTSSPIVNTSTTPTRSHYIHLHPPFLYKAHSLLGDSVLECTK